ncbi:MAG TPA: LysR family transcriptional regulator substrate-binding protein [Candidatus Acidoferrum sp.]
MSPTGRPASVVIVFFFSSAMISPQVANWGGEAAALPWHPQIVFESGQFSSILSMVSAGLGISVVPQMAVEKRPTCQFVPLNDEHASRTIGAVTLKGKSQSRVNKAFLAHLRPG